MTTVTVRVASRTAVGSGCFHEVGISLSFNTRDETGRTTEEIVSDAGDAFERSFHQLLRRLDAEPRSA
jgi:hypothetical protein